MNKYQEALEKLYSSSIDEFIGIEDCKSIDECKNNEELDETLCYGTLKELVDKVTPKKPVKDYSMCEKYPIIKFIWGCPNCNSKSLIWADKEPNVSDKFCSCCGQALDWSEDE